MHWSGRRMLVVGAAGLAAALLLLALLHSAPARSRALAYAVRVLRDQYGTTLQASDLRYSLLGLRFELRNVRIAATTHQEAPFLQAGALVVDLRWSALIGELSFDEIELRDPILTFQRPAGGAWNLPLERRPPGEGAIGAVYIDRLLISNLQLAVDDRIARLSTNARALSLGLEDGEDGTVRGTLRIAEGLSVRIGEGQTHIAEAAGAVAFDGRVLSINDLRLSAPEGTLSVDGTLRLLDVPQRVDAQVAGSLDLSMLSPWLSLRPAAQGIVRFEGRLEGPLFAPSTTLALSSADLSWSRAHGRLDAAAIVSGTGVTVESARLELNGGTVSGSAKIPFSDVELATTLLEWHDVDIESLLPADTSARLPRLDGRANGAARLSWQGRKQTTIELTAENTIRPAADRRDVIGVGGRTTLDIHEGAWHARHDHLIAAVHVRGEMNGMLSDMTLAEWPLRGSLRAVADNLGGVAGELAAAGWLRRDTWIRALNGAGTLEATLEGTLGAPRLTGAVRASGRPVDTPATVIDLEAIVDVRTGQASVRDLRLLAGPNSVHGWLHVAFPGQVLEGALRAEVRDIATLPLPGLVELRAFGSGTVAAQLGGTVERPQVVADISARQLSVFEQPIDALKAQLRVEGSNIFARSIELTQRQGHATLTGAYDLRSHAFEMRADARGTALRATDAFPLSAILDSLTFSASGTLERPEGRGRIELSRFDVHGVSVAPLSMDLTLGDGMVLAAIRAPDLALTADGRVTIASPWRFQLDGRLEGTSIAKVQEAADWMATEPRLDGVLSSRVRASGSLADLAATAVNVDLMRLEAQTAGVPIRLEAPIVVDYARNGLTIGRVQLRIGRSLMTAEGTLPQGRQSGTVRTTVKGDLSDLAPFLQLLPNRPTVDLRGATDLALDISGSLERLSADGALAVSGAEVRWRDLPPVHADLSATYTNGVLELQSLRADWQGARVSLAGRVPARLAESWLPASVVAGLPVGSPPGHLDGRIEELTARALDPFVADERLALLGGRVDATIRADIARPELSGISGEIVLDNAELMLAQVPLSQTTPTRLRLNGDRLTVERSSWSGGTSEFNLNGAVTLGTATSVDARIVGAIDLRTLGAFVGEINTAGRAGLDLGVSGPISAPEFEGAVAVSEGTVRLANPRVIVTEINGSLDVARDRVTLREMRGTANGGEVALSGGFEYSGLTPTGGSVTATAREVAFEYPAGFRSESDAELTLSFPGGQPSLGGRITVLRGRYRESLNLAGLFVEAGVLTAATAGKSERDFADRVRLDVALTTASNVVVDNNYGKLELDANLRILGGLADPVMAGRIALREGSRIFLGGRTYQVESGAIDYGNSSPMEPDVEIVATTRVADYVVTLVASGRPGNFTTELTAEGDQSLSERDILALLLTGRVPEGGAEGLIADVDSQQVLGLLSSEVTGLFDRLFGLRGVRFEQGTGSLDSRFGLLSGDTDPSARLTIEQTIGSQLRVIVSQNLREADPPTWLTIYRPTGRLDARFISRDDESRSMEVGQELSFGAAKRDQVPRQTRKPPMEFRVADVRFEGSPGFTRDELLGHLSQRPGTTFDFVRWQEDRDRLERVYRDRGFLEARISARRAEAPQVPTPAVVLEYQVERGPRTTLLVTGATLPPVVYRDLEDLWSGAVFDELLADDLARRVRTYLAETGHLQPGIEAHLDLDLARATKTVRIQIDPGTRSEKRQVQFEGASAISPDQLQAFLRLQGLERTVWLDRDRVGRELENLYRRTGYLAAKVAIPPPTLEGPIARLVVRIAEGSPFTIGTVKLAGVERRDPSIVQRELTLEPGTLFRPDLIDEGVRRLEQGYRDNGYREAQIEATTVVDRSAGAVDVTVGVREGPQHVIQEVTITGGEAADRQTIDGALQLSAGRPVNTAVLSEARRRLYRLGRFERVDVQGAPVGEPTNGVQPVRAAVTLQEAPRYVFRYALQGSSALDASSEGRDLTASALAELRRRNLFGRAASAGGVLLYRPNRRIGRASLTVPALLTERMESSAYLSRSQERFGSGFLGRFVANKTELTLEQLYRSAARGTLVFNYRYERNHTFAEADPGFFDLTVSVARLSGSFVLDRRDDPLNARRGLFHSSTMEYASSAFGSDLHFAKWFVQQFLYRPAGPVVFASAARVGAGYPLGGDLTLIPSERFLTGGSTSVRGYDTDSLGPQSGLGDPTGGQGFLLLNQEARFPVYGWIGGVGFIDAGNVFERAQDISFRGLKVGVGVGLRINTPVALLRFDVARPWSPGPGESGYRWHFSIGQLF